jgi:hypothetical protein
MADLVIRQPKFVVFKEEPTKPKIYGADLTTYPKRPAKMAGGLKRDAAMAALNRKLQEFAPATDVGRGRVRRSVDELVGWADRPSDWPRIDGQPLDGMLVYLHRSGIYQAFWVGWSIWHFAYQNRKKPRTPNAKEESYSIRGVAAEIAASVGFKLVANSKPGDTRSCDLGRATEVRSSRHVFGPLQIYPDDVRKHPSAAFVLAWPLDFGRDGYTWFFPGWMTAEEAAANPKWAGSIGGDKQQLVPWRELHPLPPPEVSDG